jgi:chromosomal replication initiation ATPase DnaA
MEKIPAQTCKAYWIVPPVRQENNCLDIIHQAADYFQLRGPDLMTRKKTRDLALPRMIIMHALYFNSKLRPNMKYIGKLFNRDHTTVVHAIQMIQNLCEVDEATFRKVREFHEHIYGHVDYFNSGIRQKKRVIKL